MFNLSIKAAKGNFFDEKKIIRASDRAKWRALSKIGAFVRRRAKQSIRQRKRPSAPGSPPSSHTGLLKRFIYFSMDRPRSSVVIGPARLDSTGDSRAPAALEYGGSSSVRARRQRKPIQVAARPFMGPALAAEAPGFVAMWKNRVR